MRAKSAPGTPSLLLNKINAPPSLAGIRKPRIRWPGTTNPWMTETVERVGLVCFSVRMAQRGASETAEPLADLETSRASWPEYPAVPSWDCWQYGRSS